MIDGSAPASLARRTQDHHRLTEILPVLNPIELNPKPRELRLLDVALFQQPVQRIDHVLCGCCRGFSLEMVELKNHGLRCVGKL